LSTIKAVVNILTILLVLCLNASQGLAADRLALLVSSGSKPFIDTLTGLQEYFTQNEPTAYLDIFHLDGESGQAHQAIEKIKLERHDAIITLGALAFDAAVTEFDDIPIVAGMILSKKKILSHQNATGVSIELPVKIKFNWLKKFFPEVQDIGVLYNPDQNQEIINRAAIYARSIGLNLIAHPVSSPRDLPDALKKLSYSAEVLWSINDSVVLNRKTAKNILLFSFRNKIPFVGLSQSWVKAGAYYALDRNYQDIGVQCGEMVSKILAGIAVDTIEPSHPRLSTYSVNSKTAKKMNIPIEPSLIENAVTVY
jgi:putative ABC transport system substrate-binding protein